MFNGYLALGSEDIQGTNFEIVNSQRAVVYYENWNAKVRAGLEPGPCFTWLDECDACPPIAEVVTDGAGYFLPENDPAPWYDPAVRDSERFLGVIGLSVSGAEDSTRNATVQQNLSGEGGFVGRLFFGPRNMVVTALAIAADDCGLEVGLNWLRCQFETQIDPCLGDALQFFDCCPDCVGDPDAPPAGPCWGDTYADTWPGPPSSCDPAVWWPSTYAEIESGPPPDQIGDQPNQWCRWVANYEELETGLPEFSCELDQCLVPYVRQFRNARIVEGPTVLARRQMSSGGVAATIEFTITAADPAEYTVTGVQEVFAFQPDMQVKDRFVGGPPRDPFNQATPRRVSRQPRVVDLPTNWDRQVVPWNHQRKSSLSGLAPVVRLAATAPQEQVRVGIWEGEDRVFGFTIPFIPAGGRVDVNTARRLIFTQYSGVRTIRNGWAGGYDGKHLRWDDDLAAGGDYTITVDRKAGDVGALTVAVLAAEKGCA